MAQAVSVYPSMPDAKTQPSAKKGAFAPVAEVRSG